MTTFDPTLLIPRGLAYGPPAAMMPGPTYLVEISFNSPTTGTFQLDVSQLDVGALGAAYATTAYQLIPGILSIRIRRGRQDELAVVEPGTCDVVLDNSTGALSPKNPASPYWPNVLPMRRIRVSAIWQGVTYRLFTGFVESYTPKDHGPVDGDMVIHGVDWVSTLTYQPMGGMYPAQDDGTRITTLLGALNLAGAAQSVDLGSLNLLAVTPAVGTQPWTFLQDVLTSSRGLLRVAADGSIVYENRVHRFQAANSIAVQGRFGQVNPATGAYNGTYPFTAIGSYTLDTHQLWNRVIVNASGTAEGPQQVDDVPSQDLYFVRLLPQINAAQLDVGQALEIAQRLLSAYKDPHQRLQAISVDGDADSDGTLWVQLLSREISDRIHVQKNVPGSLGLDDDMCIEHLEHEIICDPAEGAEGHRVTWQLSSVAAAGTNPFILDSSKLDEGLLG